MLPTLDKTPFDPSEILKPAVAVPVKVLLLSLGIYIYKKQPCKPHVVQPSQAVPRFPNILLVSAFIQSQCLQAEEGERRGHLSEYKSGDQPVTKCWTVILEDLTPFVISVCCILSPFKEARSSGREDVWLLPLSLRGLWPEAETGYLFTMFFICVVTTMDGFTPARMT